MPSGVKHLEPKTSFTFLSFQIVLITFHFHFLQIFELALNGRQGRHMVLDYTITIVSIPCLLLKGLSYSNFVHSHLVRCTMHFLAVQGTVHCRGSALPLASTSGKVSASISTKLPNCFLASTTGCSEGTSSKNYQL